MRCLKTYKETNGDYNEFKQLVNDSDFLSGIDSEVSIDDDDRLSRDRVMGRVMQWRNEWDKAMFKEKTHD